MIDTSIKKAYPVKCMNGFTLIELMVVIAIIGILGGIILKGHQKSKNRAANATIMAELSSARVQSDIFRSDHDSSYSVTATGENICEDSEFLQFANAAGALTNGLPKCFDSESSFIAAARLRGGGAWCIDSLGREKLITDNEYNLLNTYTSCP